MLVEISRFGPERIHFMIYFIIIPSHVGQNLPTILIKGLFDQRGPFYLLQCDILSLLVKLI